MVKNYVLDTNVLMDYPDAIYGFEDNIVTITSTVIAEADNHKTRRDIVGSNIRQVIRTIDSLSQKGDITKGVKLPNGGTLRVEPDGISPDNLPPHSAFNISVPDIQIVSTCIYLSNNSHDIKVILVTNDQNLRIIAKCCGVEAEAYNNSIIEISDYNGYINMSVQDYIIDYMYQDKHISLDFLNESFKTHEERFEGIKEYTTDNLFPNEFITMKSIDSQKSCLSVFRHGRIELIDPSQNAGWVKPKNALQSYALWALQQPVEEIPLVILSGPAGTAKTFLSISVGIEKVLSSQKNSECEYEKIILARPIANSFKEMGALPGDIDQKLKELHSSFDDAITAYYMREDRGEEDIKASVNDLYSSGKIENVALSFIRGRSIPYAYLICDESQNSSRTLLRDVITRAAKGTKVICCGDEHQIDLPYVNEYTNGLTFAIESMKESPLAAYINFSEEQAVRSPLATEAIKRMKE